jgi:hypothetical protein
MPKDAPEKKVVDVTVKQVAEDHELFAQTLRKVLDTPAAKRSPRAVQLMQSFQVYYEEIFAFGCTVTR